MDMQKFKDEMAKALFGDTPTGCCVSCKSPFSISIGNNDKTPGRVYSEAGVNEIIISKLCETCFDNITSEEDDEDY